MRIMLPNELVRVSAMKVQRSGIHSLTSNFFAEFSALNFGDDR